MKCSIWKVKLGVADDPIRDLHVDETGHVSIPGVGEFSNLQSAMNMYNVMSVQNDAYSIQEIRDPDGKVATDDFVVGPGFYQVGEFVRLTEENQDGNE